MRSYHIYRFRARINRKYVSDWLDLIFSNYNLVNIILAILTFFVIFHIEFIFSLSLKISFFHFFDICIVFHFNSSIRKSLPIRVLLSGDDKFPCSQLVNDSHIVLVNFIAARVCVLNRIQVKDSRVCGRCREIILASLI